MPLYREYSVGDIRIAVWEMNETSDELSSLLAPECLAGLPVACSEQRRRERLAVRVLLSRLCGNNARIVYDAAGKPVLEGAVGFISISHTRGYALLAHSPELSFGIDVELLSRDASSAARRFMRADDIAALEPVVAKKAILLRWCVCEALFKFVGNVGGTYRDNVFLETPLPLADGTLKVHLRGCGNFPDGDYVAHCIEDDGLLVVCLSAER